MPINVKGLAAALAAAPAGPQGRARARGLLLARRNGNGDAPTGQYFRGRSRRRGNDHTNFGGKLSMTSFRERARRRRQRLSFHYHD